MPFHHRHHGGILSAIEDEIVQIEQMALSGGAQGGARQQSGDVMPDPGVATYGQGMYGAYGQPPANAPYGQPYGQPAYGAQGPPYGAQGAYPPAGGGTVFGGVDEGAPAASQQPYYPPAAPGYAQPQGYAQARPPQGYPPQQGYSQPPPQQAYGSPPPVPSYGQGPPPPQYGNSQAYQQPSQYPKYPPQGPPQYGSPQYPPAQSPPVAPQYLNSQAPGPQPAPNPGPPNQYTMSTLPGGQPGSGPGPQYPQAQAQGGPQYPPSVPPVPQYGSGPQSPPQPQYTSQPYPQQQYGSVQSPDAQRGAGGLVAGAAVAGAAALAYGAYQNHQHAATPVDHPVPSHLTPAQVDVPFEPLTSELKHMSHHHAMHLLSKAHHSVPKISQIIGTYLMAKAADGSSAYGTAASRPEVKEYYHEMDKMEKLSADFLKHHSSKESEWKEALGPHRRYVFAQLYNRNELVRAFCQEMRAGPLALPALDAYSLGEKVPMHFFQRSAVRQANKGAALSLLAQVRTVLLIDDSLSMAEQGHIGWGQTRSESRWKQTRTVLSGLTPLVAAHNAHGIDLHFLNRVKFAAGLKTAAAAEANFDKDRPNNGTPTGQRVCDILDAYASVLRYYRALLAMNLIVITDGEANDEELLHQTIEHHVTELVHRGFPAHQFGVEFVQVGDCEYAAKHLEKLEKEVSRHHRDVVGVTPVHRQTRMDAQELLAIAVSGIDARLNGYMRDRGVNV